MLQDRHRFDLVAHFPNMEKARMAVGTFGGQVKEESTNAFGSSSWIGLGAGIVLGVAVGVLLSRSYPAAGYHPSVLAQRAELVIALWASILGASGWIVGSTIRLFSSLPGPDYSELHITIQAEKLAETRAQLIAEGATTVTVREHGVSPPDVPASGADYAKAAVHKRGS